MNLHTVWLALAGVCGLAVLMYLGIRLGQQTARDVVMSVYVPHDANACVICQTVATLSVSTIDRETVVGIAQVLANVRHHTEDQLMDHASAESWRAIYGVACRQVVAVGREWLEELLVTDLPELTRLLTTIPAYDRNGVHLDEGRTPLVLSYVEFFTYCGMDASNLYTQYGLLRAA